MGRCQDFWQMAESVLTFTCKPLNLFCLAGTCWANRSKAPRDEFGFAPDVPANSLTDLIETMKA
jgi:hypothetical protein